MCEDQRSGVVLLAVHDAAAGSQFIQSVPAYALRNETVEVLRCRDLPAKKRVRYVRRILPSCSSLDSGLFLVNRRFERWRPSKAITGRYENEVE
jgi:hypothetical protein